MNKKLLISILVLTFGFSLFARENGHTSDSLNGNSSSKTSRAHTGSVVEDIIEDSIGSDDDEMEDTAISSKRTNSVSISTNVYNADVYIDGTYYGYSNNVFRNLRPGRHFVEVEKKGYETVSFEFFIGRTQQKSFYVTMELITGFIEFENLLKNSVITVDSSSVGYGVCEVAAGLRHVRVRTFGYEDFVTDVYVDPYETVSVYVRQKEAEFDLSNLSLSRRKINPTTNLLSNVDISFEVTKSEPVKVEIIDETGAAVKSYNFSKFSTWVNYVTWNGTDRDGNFVSDGKYTVKVSGGDYEIEETITVDSKMYYPISGYNWYGRGVGTVPTACENTMGVASPFVWAEPVFRLNSNGSGSGYEGCLVGTGVVFDIGKYVECSAMLGGSIRNINDFPFFMNCSMKVSGGINLGSAVLCLGGFMRYGVCFIEMPEYNGAGLGFGGILGIEFSNFYAGVTSEFVLSPKTGLDFFEDCNWKNGLALSYSPLNILRLSGWCSINNFTSLDFGVGVSVMPGIEGLILDLTPKMLLDFTGNAMISCKIMLSYSF